MGVRGFLPGQVVLGRVAQPSESYRWLHSETNQFVVDGPRPSGSIASGATTAVLTLDGIDTPDEGLYILHATPAGGVETMVDAVRVHVDRPVPLIAHIPQDREACLGGETTFRVAAVGEGVTYRWFKDGVLLADGPGSAGTISGAQTATLTVSDLSAASEGGYICSAFRDGYSTSTFKAQLTVSTNAAPLTVLAPPANISTPAGTLAYFITDMDIATGEVPMFQWRKDGVPMIDDGRIEGTETEQLVFNSVSADDAAVYDCVVTRGCASTVTLGATLTVTCPADFNGDGFLDFFDYDDYVNCFETGTCPPGKTADFNGDAFVDFFDYDDFVLAFETGC